MSKKPTHHTFRVKSKTAPTIELDNAGGCIYIRFSQKDVFKTIEQVSGYPCILLDLDKNDDVIGIESVGVKEVTVNFIKKAVEQAKVFTPATLNWGDIVFKNATECPQHAHA